MGFNSAFKVLNKWEGSFAISFDLILDKSLYPHFPKFNWNQRKSYIIVNNKIELKFSS